MALADDAVTLKLDGLIGFRGMSRRPQVVRSPGYQETASGSSTRSARKL